MPKFLRRKRASTPLDVLGPASADDAYATLPDGLARTNPILAQLVAEWRVAGDLPTGVA